MRLFKKERQKEHADAEEGRGAYIRNNIFVGKWMGLYPGGSKPRGALTLFRLGFLRVAQLGWGRRKVPAAYNSKTINDNEMKLGGRIIS